MNLSVDPKKIYFLKKPLKDSSALQKSIGKFINRRIEIVKTCLKLNSEALYMLALIAMMQKESIKTSFEFSNFTWKCEKATKIFKITLALLARSPSHID